MMIGVGRYIRMWSCYVGLVCDVWSCSKVSYIYLSVLALFVFMYFSTLRWLFDSWLYNPYYSHGFLVPLISFYFVWKGRRELAGLKGEPSSFALPVLIISLVFYFGGILLTARFLGGVSLLFFLVGVSLFFGEKFARRLLFPLGFLVFMVPFPFTDLVVPVMQGFTTVASTWFSGFLGVPASYEGFLIYLPGSTFEVGLPCSGIRSTISLLMVAVLFAYLLEGGLAMKAVVVASALPLAMAGNVARVTLLLYLAHSYGEEVALRYFHDFSSLVLFSVSLTGLFLVGRCFGRLRFRRIS